MLDFLKPYKTQIDLNNLTESDTESCLPQLPGLPASSYYFLSADKIIIGSARELSPDREKALYSELQKLIPWRKGPFSVFGIDIDSEWRSDLKWNIISS